MKRRTFLSLAAGTVGGACLGSPMAGAAEQPKPAEPAVPFKISLAEWSFHRRLYGRAQPALDNLDFPAEAKRFGIDAVEYVNVFFKDKVKDKDYLAELKKRADDLGVRSVLIMCDAEGNLGAPEQPQRDAAVRNHQPWVEAAKYLGCHSIRVNGYSEGTRAEQADRVADGLQRLCEFAADFEINVIVENHGNLTSDPKWLTDVIKKVGLPNCGTLPDFGNFPNEIDRYEAVQLMMPFAKAVSAKSYDFDAEGTETRIDFERMMDIVLAAGYHGYVGIEYEGSRLSENDGVVATRKLLEKIRAKRASA
ncbi:MAG: sugar phosphate isomerase/epimerase [Sedimentisphaerales bacterium]|nr:sugar phosphate isomerase/epimerase [Sedimentisphaerales bacterium]